MSKLKFLGEYDIPSYALCALVYGDYSGLGVDIDETVINYWLDTEFEGFINLSFDCNGETEEFNTNPAFGLACETERVSVYGHKTED